MPEKKKDGTQKTLIEPNSKSQEIVPEQTEVDSTQTSGKHPEQNLEKLSVKEPIPQETSIEKPVLEQDAVEKSETPTVEKTKGEKEKSNAKFDESIIPIEMAPDCESCGMPMQKASDHGKGDLNNPYCIYCTDDEGKLKNKDVVKTQMIEFYIQARNCSWSDAENVITEMMKHLPAWNKVEKPEEVNEATQ